MNKRQKKIAIKLIEFIKNSDGFVTQVNLTENQNFEEMSFNDEFAIFGELEDLSLIERIKTSGFRLTNKGWKFKSFKKLEFENRLELTNIKVLWFIAILSLIETISVSELKIISGDVESHNLGDTGYLLMINISPFGLV